MRRGDGDILALVFFAVVGLVVYGGYALWRDNVKAPDDKCYWLVRDRGDSPVSCLVDVPPEDGKCMALEAFSAHQVLCGINTEALAGFANKAGRRICGQVSKACAHGSSSSSSRR